MLDVLWQGIFCDNMGDVMQEDLQNWQGCKAPKPDILDGKHIRLEVYQPEMAAELWDAFGGTAFNKLAYYFPNPNFENAAEFGAWLDGNQSSYHTMVFRDPATLKLLGMASYMRMDPANGVVEVGAVCHAPTLQRSIAATEVHYLMAKHVFDALGYRRYEWKLHNENEPSHRAAKRFGFKFEGIFRNHIVSKGKNRDTAWYAMTNQDWPIIKAAFKAWLEPSNFDSQGNQKASLEEIRNALT